MGASVELGRRRAVVLAVHSDTKERIAKVIMYFIVVLVAVFIILICAKLCLINVIVVVVLTGNLYCKENGGRNSIEKLQ